MTEETRKAVRMSVKSFDPKSFKTGGFEESVNAGLEQIRKYLAYRHDLGKYKVEREEAERVLQMLQKKTVQDKLELFDNQERLADEQITWRWSPMFCLLKSMHASSPRRAPWDHTSEEVDAFLEQWAAEQNGEDFSLEKHCPQILRVLKMLVRLITSNAEPLSHPVSGLLRDKVLSIARQDNTAKRLIAAVQDFIHHGWLYFPSMFSCTESILQARTDVVALLGYSGLQDDVVEKVRVFLNRLARRALLDLQHMGQRQHLDTLWHVKGSSDLQKMECLKVRSDPFFGPYMAFRGEDVCCIHVLSVLRLYL